MHKLSTKIALLAFVGTMTAITPVLAAPNNSNGSGNRNGGNTIDCTLQANINLPECLQPKGTNNNNPNGPGSRGNNGPGSGNNSNAGDNNNNSGSGPNGNSNSGNNGNSSQHSPNGNNGPSGSFNFSQHDRDQFHRQFRGFNFGVFATPNFSIQLGVAVPHSYHLRPVPRSIYRAYPRFRGYLFFTTRRGDIVIVSPRNLRIVAVI